MSRIVFFDDVKEYIARNAEGYSYAQMSQKLLKDLNFEVTANQLRNYYHHNGIHCGKHVKRYFTDDICEYINEIYKGKHYKEIALLVEEKFKIKCDWIKIKSWLGRNKMHTDAKKGHMKGECISYTKEQKQWIFDNQYGISREELAKKFSEKFNVEITAQKMKDFCSRFHLINGRSGRYEKGGTSFNKGRKGWYPEGCQKGWFKKGCTPACYLPIGTERYIERTGWKVKVGDPHQWKLKGQLIWEQNNGPIPKGYVISYKDGDNKNCVLDNLVLVTRAEQAFRAHHQLYSDNVEANMLGIQLAKLSTKLHAVQKKMKESK